MAFSPGFVSPTESIYTVPVKVPVACRVDGADEVVAAVVPLMIVEGILEICLAIAYFS